MRGNLALSGLLDGVQLGRPRCIAGKRKTFSAWVKCPVFSKKAFRVFVEGAGSTIVAMISPQMGLEDFVRLVRTQIGLSPETFFLSSLGRVLDSARMKDLTRDSSVRVNFRLRGGMMQWTCDYCGITRSAGPRVALAAGVGCLEETLKS